MQPDKFTAAAPWQSAAAEDARVAVLLTEESPATAAFLTQQAAEKALKAACIVIADDMPRTHVLKDLLDELAANDITIQADVREASRALEKLYAPTRYPDALGGIDPNRLFIAADAREAIEEMRIVITFVDGVIDRARRG